MPDLTKRLVIPSSKAGTPEARAFLERLANDPAKQARIRETMDRALAQRHLLQNKKSRQSAKLHKSEATNDRSEEETAT